MTPRPEAADYDDVPADMRQAPRWLVYKLVAAGEGKKPRKIPHYASGERRNGALDTPGTSPAWSASTRPCWPCGQGGFDGLGFALGQEGDACWQGIDLDDIDQRPGLRFIADDLPGYVERSPSGHGLHAIGYGRSFQALGANATGIECYPGKRFLTVTGQSAGLGEIQDIADFIERRLAPLHGQMAQRERTQPEAPPLSPEDLARLAPELRSALAFLDPDSYAEWIAVGNDLWGLGDVGRQLWEDWASCSDKFDPGEVESKWASFRPDHAGQLSRRVRQGAGGGLD